jgi:hypothetical protein
MAGKTLSASFSGESNARTAKPTAAENHSTSSSVQRRCAKFKNCVIAEAIPSLGPNRANSKVDCNYCRRTKLIANAF